MSLAPITAEFKKCKSSKAFGKPVAQFLEEKDNS